MKYFIESEELDISQETRDDISFQLAEDTLAAIKLIRRIRNEYQIPWTFELGCLLVPNLERFPLRIEELKDYFHFQDLVTKMGKTFFQLLRDEDVPFNPLTKAIYSENDVKDRSISTKLSILGDFYVGVGTLSDLTEHFRQKGRDWVYTKLQNYQKKFDKDGKDNVFFNYLKDYEGMWLKDW